MSDRERSRRAKKKSGDYDCTNGDPASAGDPDSTIFSRKRGILVRNTRREDFAAIERISRKIYPHDPWTSPYLEAHHRAFPEGQLVAVDEKTGDVVGMAAGLLVSWDEYDALDSYWDMTDGGWFTNHDPEGQTLYGAEVMVDPDRRRQGIGSRLYEGRRALARRLGVRRILAGARLPGYAKVAERMGCDEYVRRVVAGELADPTLSFQLSRGFRVVRVVPDYMGRDHQSRGYAALIEWPNDRLDESPEPDSGVHRTADWRPVGSPDRSEPRPAAGARAPR